MLRRSKDSGNPRDNNWHRLWERPSKKSYWRRARTWLRRLSSDPPHPEASAVPAHSPGSLDPINMASNPTNQSLEDQFLRWRQDMETKQEEQARQMAELRNRANHLEQENDRMRARLEEDRGENARERNHLAPPVKQNRGKEPILPGDSNATTDDELSSGSSSLPDLSPPKNNMEVESTKRPPRRSSCSVSGMHRRVRREISRERRQSMQALENVPTWHRGVAPSLPFMYPTFGAAPAPHMLTSTTVRGPEDMLSSSLGQHILSYEPPRGFAIPSFAMYDGSSNPYDHMLYFNQAMILNAGNDRLLCKVFRASLKGPVWLGSANSLRDLSTRSVSCGLHLFPSTCSQFDIREISALCKPSLSGRTNPSAISLEDLDGLFNRLIRTIWMRSSKIFKGALGRPPHSSTRCLWILLRKWRNCIDGRISIQR